MRSDTKAELQMLREFFWFLGPEFSCYFCYKPLIDRVPDMTFGHRRHPPVDVKITLHHRDRNRENNDHSNLLFTHRRCHEAYHAKERADAKRNTANSGTLPQSAG